MADQWDMFEIDVLRQIGSSAAEYGNVALSELLGRDIKVSLPTVVPLETKDFLGNANDSDMISVQCDILKGLEGKLLLTFDNESARRFISICYPQYNVASENSFTELGLSALKEVGNVVMSAYVKALSQFLNSTVVPSPPMLLRGSLGDIIASAKESDEKIYVLLIDTVFERAHEKIEGRMEFMLTRKDKDLIHESCPKY
ncbi:MAG: hypothetical protein GY858_07730 [Candidatus Omnitrophica bacterium]|nr:hypothetical protein [Candidatus Omnitrophota bacterium]